MRLLDKCLKDCVCVCVCVCITYHSLSYHVYFPTDCAPGHFCVFGSNAFPHHPSFWWISCFDPSPLDVWTAVHLLQVCRLAPKGHHSPPWVVGPLGPLLPGRALTFPLSGTVTSVIGVLRLPSERKITYLPLGKGDLHVDTQDCQE